jgi:hypothetical protein
MHQIFLNYWVKCFCGGLGRGETLPNADGSFHYLVYLKSGNKVDISICNTNDQKPLLNFPVSFCTFIKYLLQFLFR